MQQNKLSRREFLVRIAAGAACAGLASAADSAFAAARMDAGEPSATALGVAKLRAVHQILEYPHILFDPFAVPMLGPGGEAELRAVLPQYQLPRPRGMRADTVLRSRYADDRFHDAVLRGVRQYVVLGAGLDTFAYRNQYPEHLLRVFEIDHPATQAWKRARLRTMDIAVPPSLRFAPVNFERESLADGLARAGFRREHPAFFSWLGVTMYLSEAAVMETLRFVAAGAPRSEIVFDFTIPLSSLPKAQQLRRAVAAARVARLGEPWITFFEPSELIEHLRKAGFSETEFLGPQDANRRYFAGRTDGFRAGRSHLMAALV